jgi:hypothetical protein
MHDSKSSIDVEFEYAYLIFSAFHSRNICQSVRFKFGMKSNSNLSSISRFLCDRLRRSTQNCMTLSEKFIFSFLHNQSNFETIFKILYSAFQKNLIKKPDEFEYWVPTRKTNIRKGFNL